MFIEPDIREIRLIAASGSLGSGEINAEALEEALAWKPHFIASDAGTTDAGPYHLGSGRPAYPSASVKRDLRMMMQAARKAGVPAMVSSVGTSGADCLVDWMVEIARAIAAEDGLRFRVAAIYSEQSTDYLKRLLAQDRIRPLEPVLPLDAAALDRSSRIVGMMGVEPLQDALERGAELVIAGRCSDAALYAALPIAQGFPEGLAWHVGKVVECGAHVCESYGKGVILARIRDDHATVQAFGRNLRCTPQSVAAHSFYENVDPYIHQEASGAMDLSGCVFETVEDGIVRISGSDFIRADDYTIKLEGAELVGHQSIIVGGVRDPIIIRQLEDWLAEIRRRIEAAAGTNLGLEPADFRIDFHVYGRDAVMGSLEPSRTLPHEVGIVVSITAATQETATRLAELSRQPLLHTPVPEWKGSITGFACLHNPASLDRGPVYRFMLNHIALPGSPGEMFRTQMFDI